MMYLPYKQDQEAEARKIMVDIFDLAVPPEAAKAVVQNSVKLTYDPTSKDLVEMVMPFMTASEVTTLKFDQGWVTEASVEDVKLLPGVSRIMYRVAGGDWVTREVVKDVQTGQADFILSTGDLVWLGKQGDEPSESPYWRLVNEDVLKQLPPLDKRMKAARLQGRVFPAVGNHEVWGDSEVEGLLTSIATENGKAASERAVISSLLALQRRRIHFTTAMRLFPSQNSLRPHTIPLLTESS